MRPSSPVRSQAVSEPLVSDRKGPHDAGLSASETTKATVTVSLSPSWASPRPGGAVTSRGHRFASSVRARPGPPAAHVTGWRAEPRRRTARRGLADRSFEAAPAAREHVLSESLREAGQEGDAHPEEGRVVAVRGVERNQ